MTRPIDPTRDPATRGARRVRMLLAGLLAAVMAIAGLAFASPAAAKTSVFPELDLIALSDCEDYNGSGELSFLVSGLNGGVFLVTLETAEGLPVDEWQYEGINDTEQTTTVDPGDYRLILAVSAGESQWSPLEEIAFSVGDCPDLDLTVTLSSCSTGTDGSVDVAVTGLVEGRAYTFELYDQNGFSLLEQFDASGPTRDRAFGGLPPGNYIAYVELDPVVVDDGPPPPPVFEWRGVLVEPCQPAITVDVTECSAVGGAGSAVVTASSLVPGVEYEVRVTEQGSFESPVGEGTTVVADASGTAQLQVDGLPAGASYTAWVNGVWVAPPWEEPPFVGGGGYAPVESVELAASADFGLQPCPAAPAKPVTPVTPAKTAALPATGPDDAGGMLLGAMLLLSLGGAALVAARRRGVSVRDRG